ncbi:MAG: glutathione S-transferase family protein [Gammaproteobacteria bacterium]|nr:glutathione S-transferase family protein [Gammaproteobacteria bacterium]
MLTIHHSPGTRGFRIIWLCEELKLPYQLARVDFSAEYRATPEWRRMNPVGKVPVLCDGDLTLFESGAMLQYLLDRYGDGRLQPARGTGEHALFLQWCWFAEATFGRATGEMANHKRAFAAAPLDVVLAEMAERARLCLQALEQALEGKRHLLGEAFSAADIMMGYTLQSFARHVGDAHPPNVARYWALLTERPAYQVAKAAEAELR